MKLYLDDDSVEGVLIKLLRQAGHDVQIPADAGMSGSHDAIHLTRAVSEKRVLVSRNHGDFEELHDLVVTSGGHHPGILIVRRDNNPRRDMSHRGTIVALGKLENAGSGIEGTLQVLNHWR